MKKIVFIGLVALLLYSCREHIPADVILYNAKVYTVDSALSVQEAIAIRDGKIIAVDNNHNIRYNHRAPKSIDLQGAYVYPGLIDAHCHFFGYAESLRMVNLFGTRSWQEVVERVKAFQDEHQLDYVQGRGWDQNDWATKDFPNNAELNKLFPNTPVVLTRIDGHAIIANQAALSRDLINQESSTEGGMLLKNDDGQLTGVLVDNAVGLVQLPEMDFEAWKEVLLQAQDSVLKYGLTTLVDAGLTRDKIEILQRLHEEGSLKIKLYAMVSDLPEERAWYLEGNRKIKTDRLQVNSFKFYADGALGSRGACLLHPYHDAKDEYGLLLSNEAHFEKAASELAAKGWQMNTHAIGDSANRMMLNIYGAVNDNGSERRWRIEHAQVLNPSDFKLFKQHQVIPSVQPTHATSDMYWAKDRLGPKRIKDAYAYKALLNEYGKIALGTDFPIEHISPIKTFYAATVRKDADGYPSDGFQTENALSREEALQGMTSWAAYASFQESETGSITLGNWADLTIMDKDWMKTADSLLLETRILRTYINGEEVHLSKSEMKKKIPSH